MSENKIDVAIVGGGILGLWTAYTLLRRSPNISLALFEAENFLGEHTSGRNSEVLHSGLYYKKNSLKHLLCMQGNDLWREYVSQKALPFLDCGKVIVAGPDQGNEFEELYHRGKDNGLLNLKLIGSSELEELKNHLHIYQGFFIESAGVLNVSEAIKSLRIDIESLGGIILTQSKAEVLERSSGSDSFFLKVHSDIIESSVLINCAGLGGIDFRTPLFKKCNQFENYFVKGNYLKLKKKCPLNKLIYPIPPKDGLGLGVHLTLDTAGDQKFGPNTQEVNSINYNLTHELIDEMLPSIQKIFKNINAHDLQLGYSGIRPKIKKNGQLMTDFIFQTSHDHGIKNYFEFLGIESPGVTAAPALALKLSNYM